MKHQDPHRVNEHTGNLQPATQTSSIRECLAPVQRQGKIVLRAPAWFLVQYIEIPRERKERNNKAPDAIQFRFPDVA